MNFFNFERNRIFEIFGMVHIIVLLLAFAVIGLLIWKRNYISNLDKKDKISIILGSVLLFLDFSFYFWKFINGKQELFPMPMHLCSWATYLVALSLITRNKHLFHISLYYGFIGGILSLFVPEFGGYSFDRMRFYQFFLLHTMLIVGPLYQFLAYKKKVSPKYMFVTLVIMFAQAGLAFIVNALEGRLTGIRPNMMFVYEAPSEVASIFPPSPWHLFVFAILFLIVWSGINYLLGLIRFDTDE